MRGKTPQGVFLAPDFPQIQPVRSDVLQLPKLPFSDQTLDGTDARMVLQQMAYHENAPVLLGQIHQCETLAHVERQRFLDKHIFAGLKRAQSQVEMPCRRGRDSHTRDARVGHYVLDRLGHANPRTCRTLGGQHLVARIADERKSPEFMEVARKVASPISGTDEREVFHKSKIFNT